MQSNKQDPAQASALSLVFNTLHICCALCFAAMKHCTLLGSRIFKKSSSNYTGYSWIGIISHPHLPHFWLIIRLTRYDKWEKTKNCYFTVPEFQPFNFFPFNLPNVLKTKDTKLRKRKTEINQHFNYGFFENVGTEFWVTNTMASKFFLFWRPFFFHCHSPQRHWNYKYTSD